MKYPVPMMVLLLLMATATHTAIAQTPAGGKPKIFSNYPEKIICTDAAFSNVFAAAQNQQVQVNFSTQFTFDGTVTSNVVKYSNLQTVVIQSPAFNNTILVLSKITNKDGSIVYNGHIINQKYGDGYEMRKDAAGNYQLTKIDTEKVIPTCSQ
ncbi:MAG: hypothetical protein JST86_04950 [Bacteroidetes bacterium]|nr:hypothetical protein [Bacteroidota bacterium]